MIQIGVGDFNNVSTFIMMMTMVPSDSNGKDNEWVRFEGDDVSFIAGGGDDENDHSCSDDAVCDYALLTGLWSRRLSWMTP